MLSKALVNHWKFLDDDKDLVDESTLSAWFPDKKGEQKVLYPPTQDEQIVNAALLNFLTLVTIAHPRCMSEMVFGPQSPPVRLQC
jgi:hypothetical protein